MPYTRKLAVAEVAEVVERHYGLQAEVSRVQVGYMSTALRLKVGRRRYLLKVYRTGEVDREQIAFGLTSSRFLKKKGLPVGEPVCNRMGDDLVAEGENLFLLWRFIDGDRFQPGNRDQLQAAGALLGSLHRVGREMPIPDGPAWGSMWRETLGQLKRAWQRLEESTGLREGVAKCRTRLARLEKEVSDAALCGLPTTVIHGDYRAQNLLYRGTRVAGVLDLDTARPAQRIFDLAYALMFFQAVVAARPLTEEELEVFLKAYDKETGLDSGERALLPACLELSLLRGLTLWMQIGYLERANAEAAGWLEAYLPMLEWVEQKGQLFVDGVCCGR